MTDHCPTCNVPWTDHGGIAVTCAEVQRLRAALQEIYMIKHTFPGGRRSHVSENRKRWQIARAALVYEPKKKAGK